MEQNFPAMPRETEKEEYLWRYLKAKESAWPMYLATNNCSIYGENVDLNLFTLPSKSNVVFDFTVQVKLYFDVMVQSPANYFWLHDLV